MNLSLECICSATGGKLLRGDPASIVNSVSVDSRTLNPGAAFFALVGQNSDGHDYINQARQKGAAAVCVSQDIWESGTLIIPGANSVAVSNSGCGIIRVPDTLQALQDLARNYRRSFNIPVVGVTGSVGKTTTKDLIALCLQGCFNTLKSSGNYNNDIGLPLSLLQLEDSHQIAVVEMAMRDRGEIARLARISLPTCAVITNVEKVHLETLHSLENIARAKCEILAEMDPHGFALINGDCPLLVEESRTYPIKLYMFGRHPDCHFQIQSLETGENGITIRVRLLNQVEEFIFPLPAARLAGNVLAAVAMAFLLGVPPEVCRRQLLQYRPEGKRLHIIRPPGGGIIIDDTYNANPLSVTAALECGRELPGSGKWVAVLGDMFELGENQTAGHMEVGRQAAVNQVDHLIAVGERAQYIARGAEEAGLPAQRIHYFPAKAEALSCLRELLGPEDKVLFKASRGMQFETLIGDLGLADGAEHAGEKNKIK